MGYKLSKEFTVHSVEPTNDKAKIIVDAVSLAAGLDYAINSVKEGEISKTATQEICNLIFQSYMLLSTKIAFTILQDEGLVSSEDTHSQYNIVLDLPDEEHQDLQISYKTNS